MSKQPRFAIIDRRELHYKLSGLATPRRHIKIAVHLHWRVKGRKVMLDAPRMKIENAFNDEKVISLCSFVKRACWSLLQATRSGFTNTMRMRHSSMSILQTMNMMNETILETQKFRRHIVFKYTSKLLFSLLKMKWERCLCSTCTIHLFREYLEAVFQFVVKIEILNWNFEIIERKMYTVSHLTIMDRLLPRQHFPDRIYYWYINWWRPQREGYCLNYLGAAKFSHTLNVIRIKGIIFH